MIPTLNVNDTTPRLDRPAVLDFNCWASARTAISGSTSLANELVARTHRVTLLEATRRANAALFGGDETRVPREGLTMGHRHDPEG